MLFDPSQMRFLVVDDELHIRKIIKAVCSAMGVAEIVEAQDGRSALQWLRSGDIVHRSRLGSKKRFDLIICDWMMPEMNGIELLRSVRSDTKLKKLPFLMLTAENESDMVMLAINEGVSDYVVKPFTADILELKIKQVLQKDKSG